MARLPHGVRALASLTSLNGVVLLLCVATTINMLGQGIISPVLPLYARSFGVGAALIGMAITVFGLARLVLNVPVGYLSDRTGRRLLLVAGQLVTALGSVLSGLAGSIWPLLAFRFLAGAGSAMFMTGAMIYLADISDDANRGRMMSVYQGSILLGASLGPAVGGFVAEWFGLRAPFFLVAATAGLCAAWVYLRVPEVRSPAPEPAPADGAAPPPGRRGSVWTALADPNFLLVGLVAFGIFFTRTGARQTILPLVGVERFELTPGTLGLVFMLISVLNFVTIGPSGYIADRWGRKLAIAPGALVAGAALALFAVDGSLWLFLAASVLLGLGTGLAGPAPAAYVSDIARPELRGATLGLYRTLGDVGFVIGPPLLGFVADQGGLGWPLLLNAVLMAGAAAAFWLLAAETVRHRTEERAEAPARGG